MTPDYTDDDFAFSLQGMTDYFIILPYLLPYCRMVYRLLYEKEKHISEGKIKKILCNNPYKRNEDVGHDVVFLLFFLDYLIYDCLYSDSPC